jgi:NAD(P)-dependent dehydrogenase (short-subunit alcohol dehydrogenase family)
MQLDVTDPAAADAAVASVVEDAGRLDVLVNNAGMAALYAVEETPDETMRAIFETNYFGPIRLARAAVPVMRAQGGGRIVNVTSINDVIPAPFVAQYSASKAALASASLAFGAEVHGFGIFVTVVAPGFFLTPLAESVRDAVEVHQPRYRAVIDAMQAGAPARLAAAGDPGDVATT